MGKMRRLWLENETSAGLEIRSGPYRLTPISRASVLRSDMIPVAFGWYRPVGIEVKDRDDAATVIPIRDPTRWIQIFLYGIALLAFLSLLRPMRK
jgi:hypothetical protein